MSLSVDFRGWFRKSILSTSRGSVARFNKLVKRLEAMEAGRTVRPKRAVQQRKAVMPLCRLSKRCLHRITSGYCGGRRSNKVSQFDCYRYPAARTAVA